MKKIFKKSLGFLLCVTVLLCSVSVGLTALAETVSSNLWANLSTSDFATKDTDGCPITGYEQYNDGVYGKAFHIKGAYYTSFYVKMPELEPNTEYFISFRYNNIVTSTKGTTIEKVHVVTEDQLNTVDVNGKVTDANAICIGSALPLDQEKWTLHTASFTTGAEKTNYYFNVKTGYAYWLELCDMQLIKGSAYQITVTGGTADKELAQAGETVTLTATPKSGQTFTGWSALMGNVDFSDPAAESTTFKMPAEEVIIKANYESDNILDTTEMPNLLKDISVENFASKDQTPNTTDFGFTAQNDSKYITKYMITNCWYSTFYVSLPNLKPNTEYYIAFRYYNDIQVVTKGKIEAIHLLNDSQLASVDADGKVTDSSATALAKNIPLDQDGWTLFTAYFTTSSDDTNYYINVKTGYVYNLYLCDFVLKETVERPVVVAGGTANTDYAKVGEKITITATPEEDQKFMGWKSVVGDPVLEDELAITTSFLMPDSAVSVKANYYENLLSDIDTDSFGSNDQTLNSGFGFEKYTDPSLGTAFKVKSAYYTTFYLKLPELEPNAKYNLSIWYDNVTDPEKPASILKIDLLNGDEFKTADDGGKVASTAGKRLATRLDLDKGKWTGLHVSFETGEDQTEYYLNFETQFAYLLNLGGLKLTQGFSKGVTVTNGLADNPFPLEGEKVTVTADQDDTKTFNYWKVVSGGIALTDPYSVTTDFTMGNMAASVSAVYLSDNEIKIHYLSPDGAPLANAMPATHSATFKENGDGTATAVMNLYSYDGSYIFAGWYSDEKLLSTDKEYTFSTKETDLSTLTAKVIALNLIDGDPGFEGYVAGATLRVDPANQNVLPYNEHWGIWNRYSSATQGFELGYEYLDWGYTIKAYVGETTDYYRNYTYSPETAVYSLDEQKTAYTVTPYEGNVMLGSSLKSRSMVRKLQNLKPNTEYQVSFYVNNPSKTDFLNRIVVANTYDLDAGRVDETDERLYGIYEDYDGYADYNTVRKWGKMSLTFKTPADINDVYLHFNYTTTNPHSGDSKVFIDSLTCLPTTISYGGNAIRKSAAGVPQALRYKFTLSDERLKGVMGMEISEIGILAIDGNILGANELVLEGEYAANGNIYTPAKGIVKANNIRKDEGDDQNSYFTAALYNIGAKNGQIDYSKYSTDYTVRAYFKLKAADGKEIVMYSAHMDASVFAVVHEIYSSKNNADDRAAADEVMKASAAKTAYAAFEPKTEFFVSKEEVTDYAFSIAVVGDPQKSVYFHPEDMHYTYDWIVENIDAKKTEYVITLGDITEYSTDAEYVTIETELKKVQNAGVPQAILRGNHDTVPTYDANITKAEYGAHLTGSYDNTMKNVYHILTMGGQKYMIMTLDYYDQLSSDIVDWAAKIVEANPDCRVILNTHGLISTQMQTYSNPKVQYLHNNLIVKYENIDLVLCGHDIPFGDDGPIYKTITGNNGNKIVEMVVNPQTLEEEKREAFGLVATLYFGNDGKTVTVEYYSTVRKAYYMDKFQFSFELE